MASRSEIARQDQASEQRRNDACAAMAGLVSDQSHVAVLSALIEAMEAESTDVAELRRKGWQSTMKAHITAAEIVKVWRDLLINYTPPRTETLPQPAEIAVDHRADTPAELEQRLTAAFGPELAPTRHIRTVVEDNTGVITDGVTPEVVYGNLCGKPGGSFTHPGGSNCPDCHALYAEQNDGKPYAGPTARDNPTGAEILTAAIAETFVTHEPLTNSELTAHEVGTPAWSDGPVTPEVARAMREAGSFTEDRLEVKVGPGDVVTLQTGMPAIIEPAPRRPARARMTAAQVREHGLARQKGLDHRSVSQVQGFADCGTRYALADLERPAWWNVGGKAFHACAELINRNVATVGETLANTEDGATALWLRSFDEQIAEQCAATPDHPMDTWRAANKGSEHYDWWRVEGPVMVQKYVVWLSGMIADGWRIATVPPNSGLPAGPVIEYACELDVGIGVPNLSVIDLALFAPNAQGGTLIVDLKAGNSAPKDTFQLGVYGWCALSVGIAQHPAQVRGAYYRARKGEMTAPLPVLEMHPWPDVVQRYRELDFIERQGVYMPNVTSFCGGCGVRDLCPAQASS